MDDFEPCVGQPTWQRVLNFRFASYQIECRNPRVILESSNSPTNDDRAAVVATHDIHCNSHSSTTESRRPRVPKLRLLPRRSAPGARDKNRKPGKAR